MSISSNKIQLEYHIDKQKVRNQKYFVYKSKHYPIDFDLLVKNSNYFYQNRQKYEYVELINLLGDEEDDLNIPEEAIESFIESCENRKSKISLSSIIALQYLSTKFEYPEIMKITNEIIKEHQYDINLEKLLFKTSLAKHENELFFDTSEEERIISSNIDKYIKCDDMMKLPIEVLSRIMHERENKSCNKELTNYLFKILDQKGRDASILFNEIDFKQENINVIYRLLNEYSDKFDFNMINSTMFKTMKEMTSEMTKQKEEYSIIFSKMKNEIEEQKHDILRMKQELERTRNEYEYEMNKIKENNEKRIHSIEERFETIISKYDKIISKGNLRKYQKMTNDMIKIDNFKDLSTETKPNLINEIINDESNKDEETTKENQTKLKQHILCCNRIFNILNKNDSDNQTKPEKERMSFIERNLNEIKIEIEQIENLYIKGYLHSCIIDIVETYLNVSIEVRYPSNDFEEIMKTIFSIKDKYSTESYKISINIKFYDANELISEGNNDHLICEIEKDIKQINEKTFFNFIYSLHTKVTKENEYRKSFIFNQCKWLKRITIPSYLKSIEYSAFANCSVTNVIIPSSVTTIEDYAFSSCSLLREVSIPSSVTSIGDYSFSSCRSLIKVTIPSSVTSIGENAFDYCSSLYEVIIPSSVTKIENCAFRECISLLQINIPSSITSINDYCFNGCTSLSDVTIPSSVNSIGTEAFKDCISLSEMEFPSSVASIGSCAFYNCSSLSRVTSLSSVKSIGYDAFSGCPLLTNVSVPSSLKLKDIGIY